LLGYLDGWGVRRITRTALTIGGAHGIFKTSRLEQPFLHGAIGPLHPPPCPGTPKRRLSYGFKRKPSDDSQNLMAIDRRDGFRILPTVAQQRWTKIAAYNHVPLSILERDWEQLV
jgi:hypothetical protein